jgi:predicted transcriptional regulator
MSYPNRTKLALWLRNNSKSQQWLANKLGVSRTAVQHWISGRRKVSDNRIDQLRAVMIELNDLDIAKGRPILIRLADPTRNYWDWR